MRTKAQKISGIIKVLADELRALSHNAEDPKLVRMFVTFCLSALADIEEILEEPE